MSLRFMTLPVQNNIPTTQFLEIIMYKRKGIFFDKHQN